MTVEALSQGLLILVRTGVAGRVVFCLLKLIGADEEAQKYKKRAKNAVLFWILAESAWQIKELVFYYYSK